MRRKRTGGKSTYYHIEENTLIQNVSMKELRSDIKTKAELVDFLAAVTLDHSTSQDNKLKKFMVTFGVKTKGNVHVPGSLVSHGHEEADTLLLLHALTIEHDAEIIIDSPDTDVFLLMVHMYPRLPVDAYFLTGKGKLNRKIAIKPIYEKLGVNRAGAIVGSHSFTGTEMCGRFAGRTKDSCMKVFMSCDDRIIHALASLGGDSEPSGEVVSQLERFVCLLYKSKHHTTVNCLRWFMYSNRQAEGESLPPTSGSLMPHIMRAQYIAIVWQRACRSHPSLPSPKDFGWQLDNGKYVPVKCLNAPAPEAIIKLVKCAFKKIVGGLQLLQQ